jgi:hypothetical protein
LYDVSGHLSYFYSGLTALHLAKRSDAEGDKWIKIGEKAVSTFATWREHSNWNFEIKYGQKTRTQLKIATMHLITLLIITDCFMKKDLHLKDWG